MSRARQTFLWMAILSAGTLVLGMLRELVIAQHMQASATADLFFRGVVVVGAARNFTLALLRARWIPLPAGLGDVALLRTGIAACTLVAAASLVALAVVIPVPMWWTLECLTFVVCVIVASFGAAIRALAERGGHERRAVMLDWIPLFATIGGTLWAARGGHALAMGATGGLTLGMLVATLLLWPVALHRKGDPHAPVPTRSLGAALYVDTLIYVNLGLVESMMSMYVLGEGDFALLSYSYMFVNAILAVPTAGATILALRAGGGAGVEQAARVRRYALLAGVIAGVGVAAMAAVLATPWVASLIDGAVGWAVADSIDGLVLAAAPFAALRMANTVGRQLRVANDPDGVVAWDVAGLVLRVLVLGFGGWWFGPIASPIALALAEAIQLGCWVRWRA
jgi:hypothetical protein